MCRTSDHLLPKPEVASDGSTAVWIAGWSVRSRPRSFRLFLFVLMLSVKERKEKSLISQKVKSIYSVDTCSASTRTRRCFLTRDLLCIPAFSFYVAVSLLCKGLSLWESSLQDNSTIFWWFAHQTQQAYRRTYCSMLFRPSSAARYVVRGESHHFSLPVVEKCLVLWLWVEIREDLSFSWLFGCDKKISLIA